MSDTTNKDKLRLNRWQNELMPFMKWMLIIFSAFFLSASLFQLYYLHKKIDYEENLNIGKYLDEHAPNDGREDIKWLTVSKLEEHALSRRYHQANVSLMAGIWMKYLGFLTGMIICLCGAVFILGKIETSSESKLELENEVSGKSVLQSSSPGIFMVLLGVVLIIFINQFENKVDLKDGPAYIHMYGTFNGINDNAKKEVPLEDFNNANRNDEVTDLPE